MEWCIEFSLENYYLSVTSLRNVLKAGSRNFCDTIWACNVQIVWCEKCIQFERVILWLIISQEKYVFLPCVSQFGLKIECHRNVICSKTTVKQHSLYSENDLFYFNLPKMVLLEIVCRRFLNISIKKSKWTWLTTTKTFPNFCPKCFPNLCKSV